MYGDGMIRSWDATTGAVQYEMQGRSEQVTLNMTDDCECDCDLMIEMTTLTTLNPCFKSLSVLVLDRTHNTLPRIHN